MAAVHRTEDEVSFYQAERKPLSNMSKSADLHFHPPNKGSENTGNVHLVLKHHLSQSKQVKKILKNRRKHKTILGKLVQTNTRLSYSGHSKRLKNTLQPTYRNLSKEISKTNSSKYRDEITGLFTNKGHVGKRCNQESQSKPKPIPLKHIPKTKKGWDVSTSKKWTSSKWKH